MTADAFRVCDEKFESSLKAVVTKLRAEQKQALLHLITGRHFDLQMKIMQTIIN